MFRDHIQEVAFQDVLGRLTEQSILILGYADDEGVRNNQGRAGASKGPERILHYLKRLPVHSETLPEIFSTQLPLDGSLLERHDRAEEFLVSCFKKKAVVITLGGGHDYGFPDASAFYQTKKRSLLNVDAHFDLRPIKDNQINSGTPFFRFVERFGGEDLIEWGIQSHSNSKALFEYAKEKKIRFVSFQQKMPELTGEVGLSICLDAFAGIRGVSAPAMLGLDCRDGLSLIQKYAKQAGWLGLYEAAPDLDPSCEDSARFAALLMAHYIHAREGFDESRLFS